ncbi:MAG: hypothetical protein TR69_WS6001001162 [candidate division WS6 bacterium OLB20]|uniref:Uncharacterized protein n=1 Tax=candidate division WS6 bacterium OLB20 TaxID=1617426 RepID=A0A136LX32_9BACT|nr:MAG: hypothetical protein TR69_WS6001001162 [candidate division WS6 bacterium OLB20]
MTEQLKQLITSDSNDRRSVYIPMDPADHDKNALQVKEELKGNDVSEGLVRKIESMLASPHLNRSIALFSEDGRLTAAEALSTEYSFDGTDSRYYLLPFFDYRGVALENLTLLIFSRTGTTVFKVERNSLAELHVEGLEDFEKFTGMRQESKSIQMHEAADTVYHGQGAAQGKDKQNDLVLQFIGSQMKTLGSFLTREKYRVIPASPAEYLDAIRSTLPGMAVFPGDLEGSFESMSEHELLTEVRKLIEERHHELLMSEVSDEILQESATLHEKGFAEIMATVNDSRVEKLIVGALGKDDADYTNPIAPNGANYIAHEVLRYGGEVIYFPETAFEMSSNNMLFRLRY